MAFEADCGASTVLDAPRVATTVRSLVPGECRANCHMRPSRRGPPRQRRADCGLSHKVDRGCCGSTSPACWVGGNSKLKTKNSKFSRRVDARQIRNSKFEIRNPFGLEDRLNTPIWQSLSKNPLFPYGNVGRVFAVAYPDRCRCVLNTPVFGGLRK